MFSSATAALVRQPMCGEPRRTRRHDRVHRDAVRRDLGGERLAEREDAGLRRDVVRLPGAAVEQEPGGRVDQAARNRRARPCARSRHQRHAGAVTENVPSRWTRITSSHSSARQVEDHARPPESRRCSRRCRARPHSSSARWIDRLAALGRGDVAAVGDGLAARGPDLGDDLVGRRLVGRGCRRWRRRGR